jgi:hypothetical protein
VCVCSDLCLGGKMQAAVGQLRASAVAACRSVCEGVCVQELMFGGEAAGSGETAADTSCGCVQISVCEGVRVCVQQYMLEGEAVIAHKVYRDIHTLKTHTTLLTHSHAYNTHKRPQALGIMGRYLPGFQPQHTRAV